jgi:hypothetical protein
MIAVFSPCFVLAVLVHWSLGTVRDEPVSQQRTSVNLDIVLSDTTLWPVNRYTQARAYGVYTTGEY